VHGGFDTMSSIEQGIWREILTHINEATVNGLLDAKAVPTHNEAFLSALRHSNEVFAAFKVHALQQEVAAKLLTPDGHLKSFADFRRDVEGITSHQCGAWLQTEYDTAVIRAHNAADWQVYEANRDIMPNLRWLPTTSVEPEAGHRAYWVARLNLPMDDSFWQHHHPGDHWNCKCSLEQNNDPVCRPADIPADPPQPGLDNNPGKDGHTFSDNHPYFPDKCSLCFAYKKNKPKDFLKAAFRNARAKDCYNCPYIDGCLHAMEEKKKIDKIRVKQLKTEAGFLREQILRNKQFAHNVTISQKKIKEWLNQPHKFYREKNELLLDLPEVFDKAIYKGETIDPKVRPGVAKSHIFEIVLCGESSYIIVHEMEWNEFQIHSISDHRII
jgi:hypothetical protein